ncbi:Desulfoferrodoxin, ferrous iron-binding region domain protein, partial [Candidatus Thiomargarita nelsonii]
GQATTTALAASDSWPSNIVYTAENPGQWAKKVGGHLPKVSIEGNKITITTDHGMSEKHYIVRHTLVSEDGKVLGAKTFSPSDEEAVSTFDLPEGPISKLYATSFCNKHDLWVTEFTV